MTARLDDALAGTPRLRICGYLAGCEEADFSAVSEYAGLSASSLSKHLTTLDARGYVRITKVASGRYTKTRLALTDDGRRALGDHVAALRQIADDALQGTI